MTLKLINYFAIMLIIINEITSESKVVLMDTEITYSPQYIQEHRAIIHPDHVTMDVILHLKQDFDFDPWIRVSFTVKNRKTNRYREVLAAENNVCKILGTGKKNLLSMWVGDVLKTSNIPRQCPIKKGRYGFYNISADILSLPDFLGGTYKANILTYSRKKSVKEYLANFTVTGIVK